MSRCEFGVARVMMPECGAMTAMFPTSVEEACKEGADLTFALLAYGRPLAHVQAGSPGRGVDAPARRCRSWVLKQVELIELSASFPNPCKW